MAGEPVGEPDVEPDQGEDSYPKVATPVEMVPGANESPFVNKPLLDLQFPENSQAPLDVHDPLGISVREVRVDGCRTELVSDDRVHDIKS